MLNIPIGPTRRRCDGYTRRDMLQVGGVGALALPALLRSQARADGPSKDVPAATAKSVILVYLGGGLSHHDSFDPKPDAPAEVKGKYGAIATKTPGIRFGELMPKMAAISDRFSLVRSGTHGNDHHETATNWVLSGRFGSAFGDYPAIGAVVSHELGYRGPMPPYFAVPRNPAFTWELGKSAFLGGRCESFRSGDPERPQLPRPGPHQPERPGRSPPDLAAIGRQPRPPGRERRRPENARRVPEARDGAGPLPRGPASLRHPARGPAPPRPLRPDHHGPILLAGPPLGRVGRAVRHGQQRRLGSSRQDLRVLDKRLPRSTPACRR